jgi:tripartite-type tricarboxylate transporter receptor subunit TctC
MIRRSTFLLLLASLAILAPLAANAQDWPTKEPIKVIVPFSAGSATDIIARTVFNAVGDQIKQTFVVENRGGAGTTLGAGMVARADPDGYTLLVNSTSQVVVASTYAHLPYSVANDFAGISELADIPFVIATSTKYNTLAELIAAGKKPGSHLLYGSAGAGSSGQLFMEELRLAAGFAATHVPFRGTPEGMNELIAGRLDVYPAPLLNALPLAKAGKIHVLAVSSTRRLALMPDVPTLAEEGLPNAVYNFWIGAFAPAKTPKPIIERLNRAVVAALRRKDIADKIRALGGEPTPMTPAEFDAFVRKEIAANATIVKASGFKPQ